MARDVAALIREAVSAGARFDSRDDGRVVVRQMRTLPEPLRAEIRAIKHEITTHLSCQDDGGSARLVRRLGIAVRYVRDPVAARGAVREVAEVAARLGPDGRVGFDIETAPRPEYREPVATIKLNRRGRPMDRKQDDAGLDPNLGNIRLAQFYPGAAEAYVFDLSSVPLAVLHPLVELPLVAHNAVFETGFLLGAGITPDALPVIDCTMLAANVLFGGLTSLADLAASQLDIPVDKTAQTSDWSVPELVDEQLAYAAADAVLAHLLSRKLLPRLGSRAPAYRAMVEAQPSVAWMRSRGIMLDVAGHAQLIESWSSGRDAAAKAVAEIMPGINPKNSAQVASWLGETLPAPDIAAWPRTAAGQLSTSASDLALAGDNPAVHALLQLRKFDKLLSTYGPALTDTVNRATGRVHADYRLGGAKTGRLSCSKPNIQNQPTGRDGGPSLRAVWAAPDGRILVGGDWNQMELRAAAIISGDRGMQEAFQRGEDLHRVTAAAVSGKPLAAIAKDGPERQLAKALNFGLLYGMGAPRFRQYAADDYGVAMTEVEARRSRDAFFKKYHVLRRWQRRQANVSKLKGCAETRCGRRVDWHREGEFRYTLALNTPIQGSCAEVLLVALARLPAALSGIDAFPVALIHDEIILEADESDSVRTAEALERIMTDAFCNVFPESSRKGLVEVSVGRTWSELK